MRASGFSVCLIALLPILCQAEKIDYSRAAKANSFRLEKWVYRHIRLYEDPCLYLEALNPVDNWTVLHTKKMCSYENKDFYEGYASVDFSDFTPRENAIDFNMKLITLPPIEEKNLKCSFKVKNGAIYNPTCERLK